MKTKWKGKRLFDIQKRKEEAGRLREAEATENVMEIAEEVPDVPAAVPAGQWISFKAFLTIPQAKELRAFFEQRGIEFKAI